MATLSKAINPTSASVVYLDRLTILRDEINLAGVATLDVVESINVPANSLVTDVLVEIVTPTGLVSTASVGDGASATGWGAAGSVNLNASAGTITKSIGGTDAFNTQGGKLYTTADTIDLTVTITGGPIITGKIKVTAVLIDLS